MVTHLERSAGWGLGEIEVHLHHSRETAEKMQQETGAAQGSACALRRTASPPAKAPMSTFGFVHGKWSLDNSRGERALRRVNNELAVLRQAKCCADFTFPAWGSQPRANTTASLRNGQSGQAEVATTPAKDVHLGGRPSGDLMIFQGPGRLGGVPALAGLLALVDRRPGSA